MTVAEMHRRFQWIYIAVSEQVLREIYAEDKRGEVPATQIEASREAALSLYQLVCSKGPPPTAAQIESSTKATDEHGHLRSRQREFLRLVEQQRLGGHGVARLLVVAKAVRDGF